MECVACHGPYVKINVLEEQMPESYMLITNKGKDANRDSLEEFYSRVQSRLHKVMHVGEQRQET